MLESHKKLSFLNGFHYCNSTYEIIDKCIALKIIKLRSTATLYYQKLRIFIPRKNV